MKKEEVADIIGKMSGSTVDAIKLLEVARPEADLKTQLARWGITKKALERRDLIKVTKAGVFSLNARGKAILKAL